jgi:ubiquilin
MGGDRAADESNVGDGVNINIRCSNGSKFSLQISLDSTVGSFKDLLAQQSDTPSDQQRLIYKGRILKDDQPLRSYGTDFSFLIFFFLNYFINLILICYDSRSIKND